MPAVISVSQYLHRDTGLKNYAHVRSRVPQGSILGPTLFFLFINDLPLVLKYCKADLFADDATFHIHSKDKDTIENNIQSDFNESNQWNKNNKMHVHDTKTSCMAVGTRQRLDGSHHLDLKSGDVRINWTTHIEYLCNVVSSKISLIRQLSEYPYTCPETILSELYSSSH